MSLRDQAAEKKEADLQLALHLSRVEAQKQRRGGTQLDQQKEAANWIWISTNYGTCRWIDNPNPSPTGPLPDSPVLIPDSEPSSSTAASGEETGNSEEDLASVPSTVQVGSPGSSGR
jgi:hypothetical protein